MFETAVLLDSGSLALSIRSFLLHQMWPSPCCFHGDGGRRVSFYRITVWPLILHLPILFVSSLISRLAPGENLQDIGTDVLA